jgi:hypothetical protein
MILDGRACRLMEGKDGDKVDGKLTQATETNN